MLAANFDFLEPETLDEALDALFENDGAIPIAGGTDLIRDIDLGKKKPTLVVSLARIGELQGIRVEAGEMIIGPLTTMSAIAKSSEVKTRLAALKEAASRMGTPQVRNRATFGGNLCNARPAADTAPPAIVAGGIMELIGKDRSKTVPSHKFFLGPGKTVMRSSDLLRAIRFPRLPPNTGTAFVTMTNRKSAEITVTSVTARITLESLDGKIKDASLCLGAVGPVPLTAPKAVSQLIGKSPGPETFKKAAIAAIEDSKPIDDFRGTSQFRKWLVQSLTMRALRSAFERARGGEF
ncbi:MAG: xanthine dehydrogenase family protein subunit M [Deltaproteobacteria bacterium]|nr:xanthine dehydrogenase family protein subunit M [Deltaproteobacteria bacterium]